MYVRDDDQDIWQDAAALARAMNIPLSLVVAYALREYKPLKSLRNVLEKV